MYSLFYKRILTRHGPRRRSSVPTSAWFADARTDGAVNSCKVVLLTLLKGKREEFSTRYRLAESTAATATVEVELYSWMRLAVMGYFEAPHTPVTTTRPHVTALDS